jgi:hypothetical protein
MKSSSFKMWFHEDFLPAVKKHLFSKGLEEKAVLLIDKCPAHPDAEQLKLLMGRSQHCFYLKTAHLLISP